MLVGNKQSGGLWQFEGAVEFRLIKVELTVKVCGYQSTGRSAIFEHKTTKQKSVEIKNNSEKNVLVEKIKLYSNFLSTSRCIMKVRGLALGQKVFHFDV